MQKDINENVVRGINGGVAIVIFAILFAGALAIIIAGIAISSQTDQPAFTVLAIVGVLFFVVLLFCLNGFKILAPNEAIVLTFFGKYYGTLKEDGFYYVNPLCMSASPMMGPGILGRKKISLKAMTLNNEKQKVNDEEGNPIEIGVVVIWRVVNTAKAVFSVENYSTYISTQTDSAIRQVARQYPYDVSDNGDEKSLRGSSQEIANILKAELQERVNMAGLEILEARISNLAYAPEIAAAMLQRQQAAAIIAARQKIVDGAVSMVEMALKKLSDNNVCTLDDEKKAAMVSNLLVVLCGNRDAQPVVNSGSIY